MADKIRRLTHTAAELDEAVDMLLEVYTREEINTLLAGKIDKETGKGLSANDFTTEEKEKLSGLENYDDTVIKSEAALNRSTLGYQRKNLLKNTAVSKTQNGVTFTVNEDSSVTASGTAEAAFTFAIYQWDVLPDFLKNTNLTLSGCAEGGRPDGYRLSVHSKSSSSSSWTGIGADTGNGMTFSFNNIMDKIRVVIAGNAGTVFENVTFYPMLRYAEISDNTYESYKPSVEERLAALEAAVLGGGEA